MQSLTISIQKLEYGGYVMAFAVDGQAPPTTAQFSRSTLQEIFTEQHHLAANTFKESPLPAPVAVSAYRPHRLPEPQTPQYDGQATEDMPNVVRDQQIPLDPPEGLVDRLTDSINGLGRRGRHVLVPAMISALVWCSMNLPGRIV